MSRRLWAQERLDRLTLVHRAVAFGYSIERQRQVEHLAGVDRPVEDESDQLRKIAAHRRGTTEQTDVPEEQIRAIERHAMRHPDVADRSAGARALNRLLHRLLRPHTF